MTDQIESSLDQRLRFLEFGPEARAALASVRPVIDKLIGPSLDRFYAKVRATPEMARFFRDSTHMDSAKSRQSEHWGIIARGAFAEDYTAGVTAVGHAHARIGLEPRWYIGGYALVLEQLISGIVAERAEDIRKKRVTAEHVGREIATVVKAALLDMDYAITVYLDTLAAERETARLAEQQANTHREIALDGLSKMFTKLAAGDLESRMTPEEMPEQFRPMAETYNEAVESLRKSLMSTRQASERIFESTNTIASATHELSDRTIQQAASIEQSSAALTEMTESIHQTSEGATQAAEAARRASEEAAHSRSVVDDAVAAMDEITQSSEKIGAIIGVIDNIAFQTNLLALNAGVEAARAGDAGRSFAVVAQEVRELAQRSARAAKEISELIATSRSQVDNGTRVVSSTTGTLTSITERIAEVNALVTEIAHSAKEQALGLSEINSAVNQIDMITQENSAMADKTIAQTEVLKSDADGLKYEMRKFLVRDPARATERAEYQRKLDLERARAFREAG